MHKPGWPVIVVAVGVLLAVGTDAPNIPGYSEGVPVDELLGAISGQLGRWRGPATHTQVLIKGGSL